MTIHLPEDLANSIRTEVLTGHFASEDEMVAAVVRDYLRQRQEGTPPQPGTGSIGAMHDDAELLDQVTQSIMQARRTRTLRVQPDE
jgi:Arc/MetJ-type ribon-helix-helix transcriptional regulator